MQVDVVRVTSDGFFAWWNSNAASAWTARFLLLLFSSCQWTKYPCVGSTNARAIRVLLAFGFCISAKIKNKLEGRHLLRCLVYCQFVIKVFVSQLEGMFESPLTVGEFRSSSSLGLSRYCVSVLKVRGHSSVRFLLNAYALKLPPLSTARILLL